MTLREWYIGQAMSTIDHGVKDAASAARWAIDAADAVMKRLSEEEITHD